MTDPSPTDPVVLPWRDALLPVLARAKELVRIGVMVSNNQYLTYALLIMSAQGELKPEMPQTARAVVEFVHSNFAPRYRSRHAGLVPDQNRWISFEWELWDRRVDPLAKALRSNDPMSVFNILGS